MNYYISDDFLLLRPTYTNICTLYFFYWKNKLVTFVFKRYKFCEKYFTSVQYVFMTEKNKNVENYTGYSYQERQHRVMADW